MPDEYDQRQIATRRQIVETAVAVAVVGKDAERIAGERSRVRALAQREALSLYTWTESRFIVAVLAGDRQTVFAEKSPKRAICDDKEKRRPDKRQHGHENVIPSYSPKGYDPQQNAGYRYGTQARQ